MSNLLDENWEKIMLCAYPRMSGSREFACGKCQPCRSNTKRKWAGRILLETFMQPRALFVTLTYAQPPEGNQLHPKDCATWLKLLRYHLGRPMRYFLVGEYGNRTMRPHYHAVLWNVDAGDAQVIDETWKHGFVSIGEMNARRALYVSQYTLKKMTGKDDPRLGDKHPEFARQSRKPYIGNDAIQWLKKIYQTDKGLLHIEQVGDVEYIFRLNGRSWPLNYRMLQDLRSELGIPLKAEERPTREYPRVEEADRQHARDWHEKQLRRNRVHGEI